VAANARRVGSFDITDARNLAGGVLLQHLGARSDDFATKRAPAGNGLVARFVVVGLRG